MKKEKIKTKQILDFIHGFYDELNKNLIIETPNIIIKYIEKFRLLMGIDYIMLLQPLLLFERHEFLYSSISDEERTLIVENLRSLTHQERMKLLNAFQSLTYINRENENTTPLIDSSVYRYIMVYPIINKYKNELGNGGIFFVNKEERICVDKSFTDYVSFFSESVVLAYNKYRINEMYKYEHNLMKKFQTSFKSAITIFDKKGKIIEVNSAFASLAGMTESACIGNNIMEILKLKDHNEIKDFGIVSKNVSDEYRKNDNAMYVDFIKDDGTMIVLRKYFSIVYEDVKVFRMLILEDVSHEVSHLENIKYQGQHDSLTGLFNRNYFQEYMNDISSEVRYPFSVIVGDINGLKLINDIFGHKYGDDVIRKISGIMKSNCVKGTVFRMGGDEFYAFLPETDEAMTKVIVRKINEECKNTFTDFNFISISLGFSVSYSNLNEIDSSISKAEAEMYYIKSIDSESIKSETIEKFKSMYCRKFEMDKAYSDELIGIARDFALDLGLRKNEIEDLCNVLELHDIGKVALESSIIENEENFEMMKTHCRIGYKIASLSYETSHLARVILNHHENWDGTGFPQGLKGNEIPYLSRIVSLIDYFHLLKKEAKGNRSISETEYIIDRLRSKKGNLFDPNITDLFISHISSQDKGNAS